MSTAETNSESQEKEKEKEKNSDTTIELQLGDIIHISNKVNEQLDDETFIIDYIDNSKAYLINTNTLDKIRLSISPEGIIGDGNITRIEVLSRNETGSYARQYGLTPGKWVDIFFGGDLPVIITGEITNLEQDMIEVTTIDGDTLYINFDYKGIPENLPIEYFQIREKPSKPLVSKEPSEMLVVEEPIGELEELEKPKLFVEPSKIQLTVAVKDIKDQIRYDKLSKKDIDSLLKKAKQLRDSSFVIFLSKISLRFLTGVPLPPKRIKDVVTKQAIEEYLNLDYETYRDLY